MNRRMEDIVDSTDQQELSEEMLGAYLEGNLSEYDEQMVSHLIDENADLSELLSYAETDTIDYDNIEPDYELGDVELPQVFDHANTDFSDSDPWGMPGLLNVHIEDSNPIEIEVEPYEENLSAEAYHVPEIDADIYGTEFDDAHQDFAGEDYSDMSADDFSSYDHDDFTDFDV